MSANKYGETPENEDAQARKVRRLDIQYFLGSPYIWGLVFVVTCSLAFFIFPVGTKSWSSWNPGKLHAGHSMLNNNCEACHTVSFQAVEDVSCTSCHLVNDHGSQENKIPAAHNAEHLALKRCTDCHIEHRTEEAFIPSSSKLCSECHSDLKAVVSKPTYESFNSLENHSEFAVTLDLMRVRLSDKAALKDPNPIKFNHAVHLKTGLKSSQGPVNLKCQACHEFEHNQQQGNFVTFEKNCRSCHALSFDDRLPLSRVPHGDTAAVYQYLLGEYSKLLGFEKPNAIVAAVQRRLPGKFIESEVDIAKQPALVAAVVEEARSSEKVLFTKTACQLCHQVSEKIDATQWSSKYEIRKPSVPKKWLSKANFLHTSHETATCESCHEQVRKSKDTSDVMIPGIDNCRSCHVEQGHAGLVPSNCSTCHQYHLSQPLKDEQKRSLNELLQTFK